MLMPHGSQLPPPLIVFAIRSGLEQEGLGDLRNRAGWQSEHEAMTLSLVGPARRESQVLLLRWPKTQAVRFCSS